MNAPHATIVHSTTRAQGFGTYGEPRRSEGECWEEDYQYGNPTQVPRAKLKRGHNSEGR